MTRILLKKIPWRDWMQIRCQIEVIPVQSPTLPFYQGKARFVNISEMLVAKNI